MVLKTSGIDVYGKTTLLDNRTTAQIQVVATGDPSNGRMPGETSDLLDFPLDFLTKVKGIQAPPVDSRAHQTVLP